MGVTKRCVNFFRFNFFWLDNGKCKDVVEESWRSQNITGWMGFVLKEKLKGVKERLKVWNREEYGVMDDRIAKLKEDIEEVDVRGELVLLSEKDIHTRKDSMVVQRSRIKWIQECDANTSFFHMCLKSRMRRNGLRALKVNDMWVHTPVDVRRAVVEYFRNQVTSEVGERPRLDGVSFQRISEGKNTRLVMPFLSEEIEMVTKESEGNKSPGPDGFNFAFFKKFWNLMKDEVMIFFDQFHANEVIPKSLSAYFVTLIPKVSSPMSMKEFWPISLLGSIYKLLAKVLGKRLAGVMDSIISKSQPAFVKGRNLVGGVLVANEMVDFAKKTKREVLVLKVDFEKTCDTVDWGFLEYMMGRLGFATMWVAWMKACVCGGSM